MSNEDRSGLVEPGAGSGWYIPEKGHVPTRDKSQAMVFTDAADAEEWLRENGYTRAVEARQAIPAEKRLPNQFEL